MIAIIKILLLSWLITSFEPLFILLNEIKWRWTKIFLIAILGCMKCLSFWLGLILTGNIWLAISASVVASLLQVIKNKLKI